MKTLETERLLLRPFVLEDADALYETIYSDEEVVRYYSHAGVLTREATRQRLAEHLGGWRDEELGRHAVILKASGQLLGQVHLNGYVNSCWRWSDEPAPPYNALEVELAFAFGRHSWGQGYAFEACTALIRYAFEELRLRRLVGGFYAPNLRSRSLHQRLGYRIEPNLIHEEPESFVAILDNMSMQPETVKA
jgi:RimJ/RimL family protein N-acetyltransferase